MNNVFIIHGTGWYPEENWFPWLKKELEQLNCKVTVPQFPTTKNQDPKHWFEVFKEYEKDLNKDTIIIAHSGGCAFLLRLLEKIQINIKLAVFVAPPIGIMPIKYIDADRPFLLTPFNWELIRKNSDTFQVYHSEDDPFICIENAEKVAKELNVKLNRFKKAGHFNKASGFLEFNELLEKVKNQL